MRNYLEEVVSFDYISIFPDLASNPIDGPDLFVGECFVDS